MLTLRCPFCGTHRSDDWECLTSERSDFLRCEACFMSFAFLIHECSWCAEESVFTWREMPQPAGLAKLVCQHCAEPLHEDPAQAENENPSQRI